MKTNFEKVIDFNVCFGHYVSKKEDIDVFNNTKLVDLKFSLIKEEVEELFEAFKNNDCKEIIDALSDIKYVLYGMCSAFGINIDYEFNIYMKEKIHRKNQVLEIDKLTNFHKVLELYINHFSNTINLVKDFNINIKNKIFNENLNYYKIKILESLNNINDSIVLTGFKDLKKCLCELLYYVNIFGIIIGIDLNKSFDIVHESNMTKICDSEELAKETVEWYLKNDSRYKTPDYKKNEFGYIIYNKETGKTLKSIKYTPANFDCLLNQ